MTGGMRSTAVLVAAVALAFAVRAVPSWRAVFQPAGVNFQDGDSWYHMRSIRNLAAHFPSESGFDPYGSFPGGQIHQSEMWDLAVASVAWVLGAGKPGVALIDRVGAWLPAILGALLPIPVFLLGRRFFGELAGLLSAFAVAVIPGTLLWETHLGVPDHHVAECLLSLVVLASLCHAAESVGRERMAMVAISGVALGMYLCIRPAGIFVPAVLAIATLPAPLLAPVTMAVLAIAALVFTASAGGAWTQFTWLSLAGGVAICGAAWALAELWRRRQWRDAFRLPAAAAGALMALGIIGLVAPATLFGLAETVRKYLPAGHSVDAVHTVRELYPIWRVTPGGVLALFEMLGGVWIPALPVLLCAIPVAWHSRRPALTLCAIWGLVMTAGGILQLRMLVYAGPVVALAAGAGAAWLIGKTERFKTAAAVAFVLFFLATSLPAGIRQTRVNEGPDADWMATLTWLNHNTPEPMGDPAAWQRFWPRLHANETFRYPGSAYGVLSWWDYGDWINTIAHRLPTTNGTQVNAKAVAGFLTATEPTEAREELSRLSARYVVLNSELITSYWRTLDLWAEADDSAYQKVVYGVGSGGNAVPVTIYLPDYFRSMAVRMYVFDGQPVAPSEITVFTTRRIEGKPGETADGLIAVRKFPSEEKAWAYMAANRGESMILGSTDPTTTCVSLEGLPWARRMFTSRETPPGSALPPATVKVFEVIQ